MSPEQRAGVGNVFGGECFLGNNATHGKFMAAQLDLLCPLEPVLFVLLLLLLLLFK